MFVETEMTKITGNGGHHDPAVGSTEVVRADCQRELESLLKRAPSLMFACLSMVDGRAFAHASNDQGLIGQRISAMTSSLLALSESFAKEALRGRCSYTALSIDHGSIVLVRVPTRKKTFALSVGADHSENIAMTLRKTLDAAETLARMLDGI